MSHWRRMVYVAFGTIANAVQVVVYYRIGTQIFDMGTKGGEYAGKFSHAMSWVETGWALEIVIVQLGLLVYLLYGPVLRERAETQVTPP